jgi:hypothetical protein
VQGAHLNPELLSNGRQKPVAKARGLIEVSGVGVSLFLWCLWPDQDPFRDKPLFFRGGGHPLLLNSDRIPQGLDAFQALGQGQAQQV